MCLIILLFIAIIWLLLGVCVEFIIGLIIVVFLGWLWRVRQYDKETTLDFDTWLQMYETTDSPFKRSGMAVAFLNQSIHMAWTMGAINSKQRKTITAILKRQRATTNMVMWLGSALPATIRAVGEENLSNTQARVVGVFLLLAWTSPMNQREEVIRNFITHP